MTPTTAGAQVLIVEDDDETRAVIARGLRARGYVPLEAVDGVSALRRWEAGRPDIVLLDLGLPDVEGIHIIRWLRRDGSTPIIILSGRQNERQKVDALDAGADDYVTKPFGIDELNARLRVALRHAAGAASDGTGRLVSGPLVLDPVRHEVLVDDVGVDLTPHEFEILRVLLANAGRIVTKAKLLRNVWGQAYADEDGYVYVHVSRLRKKLAAADRDHALDDLIVTEPGVGYRVQLPSHPLEPGSALRGT